MVEQSNINFANPSSEVTPTPDDIEMCRHHWMIESQRGAISNGICKNCGDEKPFRNSADDHDWRGYRTPRPEVTLDDTNQGTPVALTIPVFRTIDQLGGKRIA